MGNVRQKSGTVSCQLRVAVTLVILALLAFTTIRTTPLYFGSGVDSSISKLHPKQRHFCASEFGWTAPVLQITFVPVEFAEVVPLQSGEPPHEPSFPRCSDLPPPLA